MHQNSIETIITRLVKAADQRDVEVISSLLAPDFRVILHQFPNAETTTVVSKSMYLQMITDGKIGGEDRTVTIEGVFSSDTIASAKVILESSTKIFHTHYQLIFSKDEWVVISDMPKLFMK